MPWEMLVTTRRRRHNRARGGVNLMVRSTRLPPIFFTDDQAGRQCQLQLLLYATMVPINIKAQPLLAHSLLSPTTPSQSSVQIVIGVVVFVDVHQETPFGPRQQQTTTYSFEYLEVGGRSISMEC